MPPVQSQTLVISRPKLILGEGKEEERFFTALLCHMGIDDVQAVQYYGKDRMQAGLNAIRMASGFANVVSIGITRDADFSPNPSVQPCDVAFQSVCGNLASANLPFPHSLGQTSQGRPTVAILILPGHGRAGMLEDLCLDSVRERTEFACIEGLFGCVASRTSFRHPQNVLPKAQMHAWLATRPAPDRRLAEAAEAGDWDLDHPAFDELRQFIRAL